MHKTDFGENIHMDACLLRHDTRIANNLYALLYQKAAYEITKEVTGDGIVWARAAWPVANAIRFIGVEIRPVHGTEWQVL